MVASGLLFSVVCVLGSAWIVSGALAEPVAVVSAVVFGQAEAGGLRGS
jgi:hypothetical protein